MERRGGSSRERPRARALAAVGLSLVVNGAGLAALAEAGAFARSGARPATRVGLAPVSARDWEARRRVVDPAAPPAPALPAPPPAAAPAPAPRPAPGPRGLLVRVAPAPDRRRPDEARFLAERDGSVERETRFRGPRPPDPPIALAARPLPGAPGAGGAEGGMGGSEEESSPGRPGAGPGPREVAARIEQARRALAPAPDGALALRPVPVALGRSSATGGEGGGAQRGAYDPRLLPLADGAAAAGGGAPSGDPLPGVADGDATLVNTRGFRFAAFYRRVHDAIAGEWRPNRAWDARDPQDRLLGRTRRQVQVDILLDPDGRLRAVRLLRGSGLAFFDAECLRAIREAAPFPNPPRGLVGADGVVALRGWRLVFEFGPEDVLDRWLPGR